eukprot:Gb_41688 [translate_table: standard]
MRILAWEWTNLIKLKLGDEGRPGIENIRHYYGSHGIGSSYGESLGSDGHPQASRIDGKVQATTQKFKRRVHMQRLSSMKNLGEHAVGQSLVMADGRSSEGDLIRRGTRSHGRRTTKAVQFFFENF